MNLSAHTNNKGKDMLILVEEPTQRLDDTNLTTEAKHPINLKQSNRKFCLSLHYNGATVLLFVNAKGISQFKVKDSEIKIYSLVFRKYFKGFFSYYHEKNNNNNKERKKRKKQD